MDPAAVFPLAPMSTLIRVLTGILLAVPVYLAVVGALAGGVAGVLLAPMAGVLLLLYGAVWLYARPSRFEIRPDALVLVWPAWRRRIPLADVTDAHLLTRHDLRGRLGRGGRIGVGGLWGGFGWAWTSRAGLVDLYVSRQDDLVLVERRAGRALLISPDRPQAFVRALREAAARS
jgi:hypothetical protein